MDLEIDLKIESRNVTMTPQWQSEIEQRVDDLKGQLPELTHARVILTRNAHHRQGEQVAEVFVLVTLPRRHTITARKERKTFEEAIRAAFEALDAELKRFRDKRAEGTPGPSREVT